MISVFATMKLIQYKIPETSQIFVGLVLDDVVFEVFASDSRPMVDLLQKENYEEIIANAIQGPEFKALPLSSLEILSPVTNPNKLICTGLNNKEHCDKLNIPYPELILTSKTCNCITGPYSRIQIPQSTSALDWEAELAVIIGKKGKNIPETQAQSYIFGYTASQDLTARDWMLKNGKQFFLCKSFDEICPLGPWIVTKEDIPDPYNLKITTKVNAEVKQAGNTKDMLYKIESIISSLSEIMTLLPGDVILCGTPSGTGFTASPPQYLKPGDLLTTEIEQIGVLENKMI